MPQDIVMLDVRHARVAARELYMRLLSSTKSFQSADLLIRVLAKATSCSTGASQQSRYGARNCGLEYAGGDATNDLGVQEWKFRRRDRSPVVGLWYVFGGQLTSWDADKEGDPC